MDFKEFIQTIRARASQLRREADDCYYPHNRERLLTQAQGFDEYANELVINKHNMAKFQLGVSQ